MTNSLAEAWPRAEFPASVGGVHHLLAGDSICAGEGAQVVFGGWLMAAAVEAAARAVERDVVAMSCQFLRAIGQESVFEVRARVLDPGGRVARVAVTIDVGGDDAFRADVVCAPRRESAWSFTPAPPAPPPEDCPARSYRGTAIHSLTQILDVRLASPEPSPASPRGGQVLLWGRVDSSADPLAALAVLADHVPYLIARALPDVAHVITVESSTRLFAVPGTAWTLLRVVVHAGDDRFVVGTVEMWDAGGHPVGRSEQTVRTVRTQQT